LIEHNLTVEARRDTLPRDADTEWLAVLAAARSEPAPLAQTVAGR
jgi:hypothetical protein